jgi:hypothetical protein
MLTVPEAFDKFKSRLEISVSEQADASRRQNKIRDQVRERLAVDSGSARVSLLMRQRTTGP